MKKSWLSLLLTIIHISVLAQNVGIGTNAPLEKLSVGNSSQFRVDANGNITRINNVPYSFPSIQGGVNHFLSNDGSGNLTWAQVRVQKPVVRSFTIIASGFAWAIDNTFDYQSSNNINPTLVLYRGFTYEFMINAPGHPFRIATVNGGPGYSVGIVNNDSTNGVITFTVPMDAPDLLHYYCTFHAIMNGPIIIR